MAMIPVSGLLNSVVKQFLAASDGANIAMAHMLVSSNGTESGVVGNELAVKLTTPVSIFTQTGTPAAILVLKNAAGSLVSCYVTTGATAGYLMLFDAASAPADGAVTPKECLYAPANATTGLDSAAPENFANGIVAVFSTTGPFTKTASATAFIKGVAQ